MCCSPPGTTAGAAPADAQLNAADFDQLLAVREQVAKVLEPMRANGAIGAALEAEITIAASEARPRAGSRWPMNCVPVHQWRRAGAPGDHRRGVCQCPADQQGQCVRCWHHRADVGSNADHRNCAAVA